MGWLFIQSFKGHACPRKYPDARFTFEHPEAVCKVLMSTLVSMRI